MIQTLTKNWLLLALCGILDAILSVTYFVMQNTDGPLTFGTWGNAITWMGKIALATAACTIAASIWRSRSGKCWPLILNGLALGGLGLIQYKLARYYPISFLTVALLIIVMAASVGVVLFKVAFVRRRQWTFGFAGLASFGFALAFLALGLRWISIAGPRHMDLLGLGAFFGFSAICMFGLGVHLHGQGLSLSGESAQVPTGPRPGVSGSYLFAAGEQV